MSKSEALSPKEFLKSRRPSQFSDTILSDVEAIDRVQLEYYMDTLSSRNQDKDFENFSKRLCELKICPNLQPNTGPDAGGDGGADTQTYPVSEKTAIGFYVGLPKKASKDRWAFAFSVKEDWRAKVRADVENLIQKDRGYKVIYFVTSRYAKASLRSKLEDELSKKYSTDVRILDRTWILDTVFKDKYQDIAIELLNIPVESRQEIQKGTSDIQRERDLETLNKEITEAISDDNVTDSIAEKAIEVAILTRQLERPRHEVDGAHERAIALSKEYGSNFTLSNAIYQYAWTTFWWLEDFVKFKKLYVEAETKILKADNAFAVEKLFNLWGLMANIRDRGKIISKSFFDNHTKKLRSKLEEIASDDTKLSGPLYAKSMLAHMDLRFSKEPELQLRELAEILRQSKDLIGFPMRPLIEFISELGDVFPDNPGYDELFDTATQIAQERDGDMAVAGLRLVRASKQLEAEKYYEVIETVGPILAQVQKNEVKHDAIRALYFMGVAYKRAGLFWAARGSFLAGSSLAANDLWNYGEVNIFQLACCEELKWIELRLGRVAHMLEWHRTDNYIRGALVNKGISEEKSLSEPLMPFDIAVGTALLRASGPELKRLTKLPARLTKLGFVMADEACIYALGDQEKLSDDFTKAFPQSDEREKFFQDWGSLYDGSVHPSRIVDEDATHMTLHAQVLGCEVTAVVDNEEGCVEVGETILATIESFLATGMLHDITVHEEFANITVSREDEVDGLIDFTFDNEGSAPTLTVKIGKDFNPHKITGANQVEIRKVLDKACLMLVGSLIFVSKEAQLEALVKGSAVRTNYVGSLVHLGNVLGYKPKHTLKEWTKDDNEFSLNRDETYSGITAIRKQKTKAATKKKERTDKRKMKHDNMKVSSIIRDSLWSEAKWIGASYSYQPGRPPMLALMFANIDAGRKIFEAWRERFGENDLEDHIKITVVKGINADKPFHYRMGIRANIEKDEKREGEFYGVITRMHTMEAEVDNLTNFLAPYAAYGCYWIAPASYDPEKGPEIQGELAMLKREFNVREAWEIGENDLDGSLVYLEDKPAIPDGNKDDAPVLKLLDRKKPV